MLFYYELGKRCILQENSEGLHNICLARRDSEREKAHGIHTHWPSLRPRPAMMSTNHYHAQIIAHAAVSHFAPN